MTNKLTYYLNRIRIIPKKTLIRRVFRFGWRTVLNIFQEARIRFFPPSLSDDVLKSAQGAPRLWRGSKIGGLFISEEDWQSRVHLLDEISPKVRSFIIEEADQICDHVFDLLGSGPFHFGKTLDWHLDFKSGYRFDPNVYFKRVHPAPFPGDYDIKVPWEVSRCQHFPRLGQAYQITEDEKYVCEFVAQIENWIDTNPWPYGVNWNCSMEVALRAINWLWGLAFFVHAPQITDSFLVDVAQCLYIHAEHILDNLERSEESGYAGNHYVSNLVGLIYLGVSCPYYFRAQHWLEFGVRELSNTITTQVWPDGVDYESSVSYHRLVTELVLSAVWLCQWNLVDVPNVIIDRLEKMLEFVENYTKPDGTVPIIGDQDNGRVHRLGIWKEPDLEWLDHQYLIAIGRNILGRKYSSELSDGSVSELIWWFGRKPKMTLQKEHSPLGNGSRAFKDGGFYFMRHKDLYLALRAGENGTCGLGGHTHNDIFSIELSAYGRTYIVDPGSYSYTSDPETRNLFRSSMYHNAVTLDNDDVNRIPDQELFRLENDAQVEICHWESNSEFDYFSGQHHAYERLENPVVHQRCIYFDKIEGYWLVRDILQGEGQHKLSINFQFLPMELERCSVDGACLYTVFDDGSNLALYFLGQNPDTLTLSDGWVSRSYGKRFKSTLLRWETEAELPFDFVYVLYPFVGDRPQIDEIKMPACFQKPPTIGWDALVAKGTYERSISYTV